VVISAFLQFSGHGLAYLRHPIVITDRQGWTDGNAEASIDAGKSDRAAISRHRLTIGVCRLSDPLDCFRLLEPGTSLEQYFLRSKTTVPAAASMSDRNEGLGLETMFPATETFAHT
jgi:hypothetical protein